eukprot:4739793-Heterocapsa_arctica.AAC.1
MLQEDHRPPITGSLITSPETGPCATTFTLSRLQALDDREYYLNVYASHPWSTTNGGFTADIDNPINTFPVPPQPPKAVYRDRTMELLTWADFFRATLGLPTFPLWGKQIRSEASDATDDPSGGIEYIRVMQREWQHDVDVRELLSLNRNHLLLWMERIPFDPTECYPSGNSPLNDAIAEDLLITIRHRFRHRTTNTLLNTSAWNAYQTAHTGYSFIEFIDD